MSNVATLVARYQGAESLVRLVPALHTYVELQATMDEVAGAVDDLYARGVLVQAFGIYDPLNIVQLEVLDLTHSEAAYLRKRFGEDRVRIQNADAPYSYLPAREDIATAEATR